MLLRNILFGNFLIYFLCYHFIVNGQWSMVHVPPRNSFSNLAILHQAPSLPPPVGEEKYNLAQIFEPVNFSTFFLYQLYQPYQLPTLSSQPSSSSLTCQLVNSLTCQLVNSSTDQLLPIYISQNKVYTSQYA